MKLDELVEKYIKLRDKKSVLKKAYDDKKATIDEALTRIEGVLMKTFDASGTDSIKTHSGTAYRSMRTSATVADRDAFLEYIRESEDWHLLDARCAKKAAEEYVEEEGAPPPGVNIKRAVTVNVRRS